MKIILVTDTHLSPRAPAFNANWAAARRWIAAEKAGAIVHLGDITADGADHPGELAFARRHFAGLDPAPHFVPGNHDIGDGPQRLAAYETHFGVCPWQFHVAGWLCIGLNTQLFGSGAEEEQFAFLSAALAASPGRVALFLHKPLFRDGWDDADAHPGRYVPRAARLRLKAMLPPGRLGLVASGHVHQARRLELDGAAHVWVPSTSFCIPDAVQEPLGRKMVGLAVLELGRDGVSSAFVAPEGMIRHNLMEYDTVYPQLRSLDPALRRARL